MRIPKVKKRRLYDRGAYGDIYLESDRDFTDNNMRAAIWFLENRDKLAMLLEASPAKSRTHGGEARTVNTGPK